MNHIGLQVWISAIFHVGRCAGQAGGPLPGLNPIDTATGGSFRQFRRDQELHVGSTQNGLETILPGLQQLQLLHGILLLAPVPH